MNRICAGSKRRRCVRQEMQENVKKCKNFLATLIKLASHNSPSPETSKNVKALVQDLLVSFKSHPALFLLTPWNYSTCRVQKVSIMLAHIFKLFCDFCI